ncbi:MAG: hypothetical protein ABFC94_05275 [Syntrophomonas sp.]
MELTLDLQNQFRQEVILFEEMLSISRQQVAALTNSDTDNNSTDKFVKLVEKRQYLMNDIDLLKSKIEVLENELQTTGVTIDNKVAQIRYEYINRIRLVLGTIQKNDEICSRLAQEVLNKIAAKLTAVRTQKKAYQAYTQDNSYGGAWFIDKRK